MTTAAALLRSVTSLLRIMLLIQSIFKLLPHVHGFVGVVPAEIQKHSLLQPATASRHFSTKSSQSQMIHDMARHVPHLVGDSSTSLDPQLHEQLLSFVSASDARMASNITALHVAPITTLTSILMVCSTSNVPQMKAVVHNLLDTQKPLHVSGEASSGWIVLDYGSILVHVMMVEQRVHYEIEEYWRGKTGVVELDVSAALQRGLGGITIEESETEQEEQQLQQEQDADPFWS